MDPFTLTRSLIDIASVTGREKAVGEFLFAALSTLAAPTAGSVERMEVAPDRFDVPPAAITLTIPALMRVPKLIASVPGPRKAAIVRRTIEEPISTACPATILRTHPDVTLYLDPESASLIRDHV